MSLNPDLPDAIEARARALAAGEGYVKGALPHRFWRLAISERLPQPTTEAERVNRVMREVLLKHLGELDAEAMAKGWP